MAAKRPVFGIFGVFLAIVNFMIDPSLRGLHWLEGGLGSIFFIKKAYISGGGGLQPP